MHAWLMVHDTRYAWREGCFGHPISGFRSVPTSRRRRSLKSDLLRRPRSDFSPSSPRGPRKRSDIALQISDSALHRTHRHTDYGPTLMGVRGVLGVQDQVQAQGLIVLNFEPADSRNVAAVSYDVAWAWLAGLAWHDRAGRAGHSSTRPLRRAGRDLGESMSPECRQSSHLAFIWRHRAIPAFLSLVSSHA